jgi:hypothetical protein
MVDSKSPDAIIARGDSTNRRRTGVDALLVIFYIFSNYYTVR